MTDGSAKKRQGRSPAYPSVPLGVALAKAQAQYDSQGKYAVPLPIAFKAWGYSAKSSGGRDVRASLRYFGLIIFEGDGPSAKVKLSEDALRVITDKREDQTEKNAIIRRLALNPTAHKKLWAKFADGIKSDATVAHYLHWEEGYNETAAEALVAEFKETAAFARLYEPDNVPVNQDDEEGADDRTEEEPDERGEPERKRRDPPKDRVSIMVNERELTTGLLSKGASFRLIVTGQIGVKEIERLIAKLEIDKEILAEISEDDEEDLIG
jgi:hypothetical protein